MEFDNIRYLAHGIVTINCTNKILPGDLGSMWGPESVRVLGCVGYVGCRDVWGLTGVLGLGVCGSRVCGV